MSKQKNYEAFAISATVISFCSVMLYFLKKHFTKGKHFPEDPKKRPEPVKRKIRIRDLIATQPNINRKAVEEYIDKFSKKPDATKNPGISTFENVKSPENPFVGDGHHRLAALAALGHTEVTVDHHIKT